MDSVFVRVSCCRVEGGVGGAVDVDSVAEGMAVDVVASTKSMGTRVNPAVGEAVVGVGAVLVGLCTATADEVIGCCVGNDVVSAIGAREVLVLVVVVVVVVVVATRQKMDKA